ncbi:MAG TPA: YihY/virulence factor BrkB family protein [Longimicrobiaceae bacterium]|nr:YihY/virulence factor BrkB family protein [Longimicrobiaceae bacterium]
MGDRTRTARAVSIAGAARAALVRILRGTWDFTVRVYNKAGQDDIFFLAGGIAFNILVAAVPFLLLIVAIFGYVLARVVDDPEQTAVNYVVSILPPSQTVVRYTRDLVRAIIGGRTQFGILGVALFIWTSTRLFGTLRTVLRHVFDLEDDRGIIGGKIFDAQMVLVAGTLFLANTGITLGLDAIRSFGEDWLGERGYYIPVAEAVYARLLAFGFIFVMFVVMYRYLPARRIPWRISLVAAMFASVVWELLKSVFTWYVTYVANYGTMYGRVATLVVLVFWIYYSAVVFILGGEVGQVYDLYRIRRRQKELLE